MHEIRVMAMSELKGIQSEVIVALDFGMLQVLMSPSL